MLSVSELAEAYYGHAGIGQCGQIGKMLKAAGIVTVLIGGKKYIDVPEGTSKLELLHKIVPKKPTTPPPPPPPSILYERREEKMAETKPITTATLAHTIEKMVELLAEKDSRIRSLEAQLDAANHKIFSATVRKAVAVYGD